MSMFKVESYMYTIRSFICIQQRMQQTPTVSKMTTTIIYDVSLKRACVLDASSENVIIQRKHERQSEAVHTFTKHFTLCSGQEVVATTASIAAAIMELLTLSFPLVVKHPGDGRAVTHVLVSHSTAAFPSLLKTLEAFSI